MNQGMKIIRFFIVISVLAQSLVSPSYGQILSGKKQISVEWQYDKPSGYIEVYNGKLEGISISHGKGRIKGDHFF